MNRFVVDAALAAAEERLLDSPIIETSQEAHAEFLALLDAPPEPNEHLRKTMRTAPPWKE